MAEITQTLKVTLPGPVLDFLNIGPGDEVDFRIIGRQVVLCKKARQKALRRYLGYLSHLDGQDPDEIIKGLRGEADALGN